MFRLTSKDRSKARTTHNKPSPESSLLLRSVLDSLRCGFPNRFNNV